MMSLTRITLDLRFNRIPYAAGIQHIHSPELLSEVHGLKAPFFNIESVEEPNLRSLSKALICFNCSSLFVRHMRVKMFSYQPNESNLLFFKDGRALYRVKLTVTPTKVNVE